jgi:hypothetical protein
MCVGYEPVREQTTDRADRLRAGTFCATGPVFRHGRVQAAKSVLGACSQAILKRVVVTVSVPAFEGAVRFQDDALFPSDVFHVTPLLEVLPWAVTRKPKSTGGN